MQVAQCLKSALVARGYCEELYNLEMYIERTEAIKKQNERLSGIYKRLENQKWNKR